MSATLGNLRFTTKGKSTFYFLMEETKEYINSSKTLKKYIILIVKFNVVWTISFEKSLNHN
jgi:hypothetical protein